MADTVLLSVVVFIVVSLLMSLGVHWLTGGTVRASAIGAICGLAAAFVVGAASTAMRRTGGAPHEGDGNGGSEDHTNARAH